MYEAFDLAARLAAGTVLIVTLYACYVILRELVRHLREG